MNKWSTSLPSIISLSNDVQFDFEPNFMQPTNISSPSSSSGTTIHRSMNACTGSVTDLSITIQTQPAFTEYDPYSAQYLQTTQESPVFYETSLEHQTTIQTVTSTHEQFVPDHQLLQSLVAYADSFDLDSTVYSVQNSPSPTTPPLNDAQNFSQRRRAQSTTTHLTSIGDNELLMRHKSCDDLSLAGSITSNSKPTIVLPKEDKSINTKRAQFVPSETHPQFLFAKKNTSNDPDENVDEHQHQDKNHPDDVTSTTGGSKIEWGYSSDTLNELNKPTPDIFNNYEATTNIGDINANYLRDLDRISSMAATMEFSHEPPASPTLPPPVIIRKKSKDFVLKQKVDIQLLRPPTPPPPGPIIIREIRSKPNPALPPLTIHRKLENSGQFNLSKTPPPIILRERPPPRPSRELNGKPTIIYRQLPTPPPSTPPPTTVIVERLRPNTSTIIQKPAPIVIEKWLPYPPEQKRKIIYERAPPLPIRSNKHNGNDKPRQIIVEYDDINVIVDKDIQQRREIKRIHPDDYLKQHGNSLYSNEAMNHLLTNVTCGSQVRHEQFTFQNPLASDQHHFNTQTPIFH